MAQIIYCYVFEWLILKLYPIFNRDKFWQLWRRSIYLVCLGFEAILCYSKSPLCLCHFLLGQAFQDSEQFENFSDSDLLVKMPKAFRDDPFLLTLLAAYISTAISRSTQSIAIGPNDHTAVPLDPSASLVQVFEILRLQLTLTKIFLHRAQMPGSLLRRCKHLSHHKHEWPLELKWMHQPEAYDVESSCKTT